MNDKDKEAFEKFFSDILKNMDSIWYEPFELEYKNAMFDAFKYACEYKQKEINKLKEFWKPIIDKFEKKYPNSGNANTVALTSLTEAFDIYCENEKLQAENKKLINGSRMKQMNDRTEDLINENKKLREALEMAIDSASFFQKFADCNKDSWSCRCEFCRDTSKTKKLVIAREALKEVGNE